MWTPAKHRTDGVPALVTTRCAVWVGAQDVWFDSGTSWAGCLGADPALALPADLYLEGSDQHRG